MMEYTTGALPTRWTAILRRDGLVIAQCKHTHLTDVAANSCAKTALSQLAKSGSFPLDWNRGVVDTPSL